MYNSLQLFKRNIQDARNLSAIHEYVESQIKSPLSFDDILRSQIVYSVSAFDKLMHDIIRVGIMEIFTGSRQPTPKYLSETISISVYNDLNFAEFPPKEYIFEQAIIKKLKIVSYQDPTKVAEGLSYIWDEGQKWQKIASKIGMDDKTAKTTLKLIVDRRNSIVHEADIDPSTNQKYLIDKDDCQQTTDFLDRCGEEIVNLVVLADN